MSKITLKPRKYFRHEILSLMPLAVLIGAVVLAFPFKLIGVKPKGEISKFPKTSSCVFVELTAKEELRAMDIIRAAISTDASSIRDLRADLSLSTIPEREHSPVMDFNDRRNRPELRKPSIEIFSIPNSLEANSPIQIPIESKEKEDKTFSKEEMLKLIY